MKKEYLGFDKEDLIKEKNCISSTYSVYKVSCQKEFPCVPVSELKKAIEKIEPYWMGKIGIKEFKDLKNELIKELGLSSKQKKKAIGVKPKDNSTELPKKEGEEMNGKRKRVR